MHSACETPHQCEQCGKAFDTAIEQDNWKKHEKYRSRGKILLLSNL
jgi:hypothetical protein